MYSGNVVGPRTLAIYYHVRFRCPYFLSLDKHKNFCYNNILK